MVDREKVVANVTGIVACKRKSMNGRTTRIRS